MADSIPMRTERAAIPTLPRVTKSVWGILVVVALLVSGCDGNSFWRHGLVRPAPSAPAPADSPAGAAALLAWAFNNRDTLAYRSLFTAAYRFEPGAADTAARELVRDDELRFARAAFVLGTPTEPPPTSIKLWFVSDLVALPDSRPGKDRRVHKEIDVEVEARTEQPDFAIHDICRLFVVRGDSTAWPADIAHAGPDSSRWFIERWEDERWNGGAGAWPQRTLPSGPPSFALLKTLWLR